MKEPEITPELAASRGLTHEEYARIIELLGRKPTYTELGIFSVMWSEHCSYKSSKIHLKRLPASGGCVLQGPGENAGIIDIGGGYAAAFKIESHNHPSFIEPYNGAATGVGGILRDIFTMGARPVAALNSLHIGPLTASESAGEEEKQVAARNRSILAGVVRGIGDYGNVFGVATIGGELRIGDCYSENPLVNAFTLGIMRKDQIFYGQAKGTGNPVICVGARTGRDGIHGATMASEEFDEESMAKRPEVQVGDPFLEKLLLEACLEAMRAGAIIGIQDVGAGGLTSSSSEMSWRAGSGIDIDVDLVPRRESGMTPYEVMLSESQERMLIVAAEGRERQVIDVFRKWELEAVVIGRVTDDGRLRFRKGGQVVADIPNSFLTDAAPLYERPVAVARAVASQPVKVEDPDCGSSFMKVIASPNVCSKEWVYRQYDHMVRTNTTVLPGSDAAVIRVKETRRALAMTLDSNARYSGLDPKQGARLIMAEAARNLVVSGARPLALSNCLNFGSPEKPEVMWQFTETIEGMSDACNELGTPVTGGNVSFYNETEGRGVGPTPVIGMVGLIEDFRHITTQWFKGEERAIILLGETRDCLGGSEYLATVHGRIEGPLPELSFEREKAVHNTCLKAIQAGLAESAHDCSDGGLAIALAESSFSSYRRPGVGFEVDLSGEISAEAHLFAESASRIVLSADEKNVERILETARESGAPAAVIGKTGGDRITIRVNGAVEIDCSLSEVEQVWRSALPCMMER